MNNGEESIDKDFFLEKFEELSLRIEQLTDEVSKMKRKLDKRNKIDRSFGLQAITNSQPLSFTKDIYGIGSPTKRYLLSIRAVTEQWKGRKNDFLLAIRQQEKETEQDLKALGIRIPVTEIKELRILCREIISLLYVACELKNIEINDILREILTEINEEGYEMVQEIKTKFVF